MTLPNATLDPLRNLPPDILREIQPHGMIVWMAELRIFKSKIAHFYGVVISWDEPPMDMGIRRYFLIRAVHQAGPIEHRRIKGFPQGRFHNRGHPQPVPHFLGMHLRRVTAMPF